MEKKQVAIIFGGCSTEYEVSLSSAASVIEHMDPYRYDIVPVGITRDGRWLRYPGSVEEIRQDCWHAHPGCLPAFISPSREIAGLVELVNTEFRVTRLDVVVPMLHGRNGEDGTLQGLLELSGIPFVGCGLLSSAVCMDKEIAHTLVRAAGIDTPESVTIYKGQTMDKVLAAAAVFGFPLYVKPARSGSSIGITKANHIDELMEGVKLAFQHDNKVLIEQNVNGFEVGCAVLGNADPIVSEVDEIEIEAGFFNYQEKYSLETSMIHLPARISAEKAANIKQAALTIYQVLGCQGFARVDMFLSSEGKLLFNEVNTIPGFTSKSRYPNMLKMIGITYTEIVDRLIQLALEEQEQ